MENRGRNNPFANVPVSESMNIGSTSRDTAHPHTGSGETQAAPRALSYPVWERRALVSSPLVSPSWSEENGFPICFHNREARRSGENSVLQGLRSQVSWPGPSGCLSTPAGCSEQSQTTTHSQFRNKTKRKNTLS